MAYETYIGYLADHDEAIASGAPFVLELRDLETFERLIVEATVAKPGQALAGAAPLWVLDWVEQRAAEPWLIRVERELDDDHEAARRADIDAADLGAASAQSHAYAGGRGRGASMPEMLGQEEARKFYENLVTKKRDPK